MTLTIYIKGKEAPPAARLLEVLTATNLLDKRLTWEEQGEMVVIHLANATEKDFSIFRAKRQYVVAKS